MNNFHTVPIDSITVTREARQRSSLPDIEILADSIKRLGLMHPVVITRTNVLVAGERRLAACKSLGHTDIPAHFTDELDPAQLRAMELEENIKRKDIDWRDQCKAVQEYHALRASEGKPWTERQTAEAIGLGQQYINRMLAVANEISNGNERVAAAPKLSVAIGLTEREADRRRASEVARLASPAAEVAPPPETPILTADFHEWARSYDGPKFNLIHCDFPYGIGADERQQGTSVAAHGGYTDSANNYFNLIETLGTSLSRIAEDSCHLMFWFSMRYYSETLDILSDYGFKVNWVPMVWLKSDNVGMLPDPQRGPRQVTEFCFLASLGDRKIISAVGNAIALPTDRSSHMSAKPFSVLSHFFRMLVDEHTTFLDPTCGSGTSVRAADAAGASHVLGLEINPEFAETARAGWRRYHEQD